MLEALASTCIPLITVQSEKRKFALYNFADFSFSMNNLKSFALYSGKERKSDTQLTIYGLLFFGDDHSFYY